MHQWQFLNLTSWTLLVSQEVRQRKIYYCTRVKLRFLRVYIESFTMSSQQPPTKKSKQVENKQGTLLSWVKPCTSDTEPGVVEETIQIKEQPESNCLQIFRERYPKQVLYIVKVNTNGKLETRTKDIVDKFSDLTYTKKYALTEGPANLMWATHSAPPPPRPQSFYACYGPERSFSSFANRRPVYHAGGFTG